MGKLDKEQEARMAGMRYALGIAKEKVLMDCKKNCRCVEHWELAY